MSSFRIIQSQEGIQPPAADWNRCPTFESRLRIVGENGAELTSDYRGRRYQILEKYERHFTYFERISRIFEGMIAIIRSFGPDYQEARVKELFFANKEEVFLTVELDAEKQAILSQASIERIEAQGGIFKVVELYRQVLADHPEDRITALGGPFRFLELQKEALDKYTPQMVEALGGILKFLEIPKPIPGSNGQVDPQGLTSSIMPIEEPNRPPILMITYFFEAISGQRVDLDLIKKEEGAWVRSRRGGKQLFFNLFRVPFGSQEEKWMLDRIGRLARGEPVGRLKKYQNVTETNRPTDKDEFRPDDSYLVGDDLEGFMGLSPIHYERRPEVNTTDLFLFDPREEVRENIRIRNERYPDMALYNI